MTKSEFNKKMIVISRYAKVLFYGLKHMVLGVLTMGLFVTTFAGFSLVSRHSGYVAVFDFIISCFLLIVSVVSMYLLGRPGKRRGGRYVEEQ